MSDNDRRIKEINRNLELLAKELRKINDTLRKTGAVIANSLYQLNAKENDEVTSLHPDEGGAEPGSDDGRSNSDRGLTDDSV